MTLAYIRELVTGQCHTFKYYYYDVIIMVRTLKHNVMPSKYGFGNKRKNGDSHNKAARKTEGTRFAQFLRRKFGKNRPKKR